MTEQERTTPFSELFISNLAHVDQLTILERTRTIFGEHVELHNIAAYKVGELSKQGVDITEAEFSQKRLVPDHIFFGQLAAEIQLQICEQIKQLTQTNYSPDDLRMYTAKELRSFGVVI